MGFTINREDPMNGSGFVDEVTINSVSDTSGLTVAMIMGSTQIEGSSCIF